MAGVGLTVLGLDAPHPKQEGLSSTSTTIRLSIHYNPQQPFKKTQEVPFVTSQLVLAEARYSWPA